MRRMPLPIERSPVITKPPIWPVAGAVRAAAQLAADSRRRTRRAPARRTSRRRTRRRPRRSPRPCVMKRGVTVRLSRTTRRTSASICALLVVRQRPIAVVVEAQVVGRHQRARLAGLLADGVAQRAVQQVRAGVVAHRPRAPLGVDLGSHRVAHGDACRADVPRWTISPGTGRCVSSTVKSDAAVGSAEHALVADLAAALGVERRLVEDDLRLGVGGRRAARPPARPRARRTRCRRAGSPRPCPRRASSRSPGTWCRRAFAATWP